MDVFKVKVFLVYLLDYVVYGKKDLFEVLLIKVKCGVECLMDYFMIWI